jgi:hypothetical protein
MSAGRLELEQDGNATTVRIGALELVFSYRTPIAYYAPGCGWRVSQNVWGPTTGRHINAVPSGSDKARRIPREAFELELAALVAGIAAAQYDG